MNKNTFIKIFCLIVACLLLVPMVIACGDDETPTPTSSTEAPAEKIEVEFDPNQGYITDGPDDGIYEIEKGGKIKSSQKPLVARDGYDFLGWSYRRNDPDLTNEWSTSDKFDDDTTLYAQWKEKSSGSNPGGTDPSNPGSTGSSDSGTNPDVPPVAETITITFNTGTGYFEDNRYEVEVEKNGYFNGALPVPVHDDLSMKFVGWFKDSACTQAVSRSDKYTADITLYASWTQMTTCADGSYNHSFGDWEDGDEPDCTKPGTTIRYCIKCSAKETAIGDPAKGHQWGTWTEGFMRRERFCRRAGCDGAQYQEFNDITSAVLGDNAPGQVDLIAGECWGAERVGCIVNGVWDELNTSTFDPKPGTPFTLQIDLITPSAMDRIYVKGHGDATTFVVKVMYEGESDYVTAGYGNFLSNEQDGSENRVIPFVEKFDHTRKIVAVQITTESPSSGWDLWDEVAFVTIPAIENE